VTTPAVASTVDVPPLAGFTVGVTAARRADELAVLIERRGAAVLHGPAIRIVPLPDDAELLAATRRVAEQPVDVVAVTTGIGLRGWVEAAEGWGLGAPLLDRLRAAKVLARGPKARGAVRAAGLVESWSPESESNAEMLDHLLRSGVDGRRVAVQLHGEPLPGFVGALRRAGAEVVEVPVYRWTGPEDSAPLDRLLDAAVSRQLDAVTFTSAPAATNLLRRARQTGRYEALLGALRSDVLVACVGSVTAGPLAGVGIRPVRPERARLGGLVRALTLELPARARRLRIAGRDVEVRGQAVLVDGDLRAVPPAPMALLRALVADPGRVVARQQLLLAMRGDSGRERGGDEHAVETAIGRLRSALGEPRLVQTVVKRGYRLALDHAAAVRG
jgi:uroporphyrinogen-III synthase